MKTIVALVTAFILAGCASNKPAKQNPSKANWSDRVGTYTYAEALSDLGKPAVVTESENGTTAEWVLKRSPRMSFGLGVGSFGRNTGVGVGTDMPLPRHGENLRLEFQKDGKLAAWSKVKY